MNDTSSVIHAPLLGSPLGRGNCDRRPRFNATRGSLVFHLFQNYGASIFVGIATLLLLSVACAAPTPTPAPTSTPMPTVTPTPEPSTGNWIESEATSPMDDTRVIGVTLKASESTGKSPLLRVLCLVPPRGNPETSVVIEWGAYLGVEDWTPAAWRVDSEESQIEIWDLKDGDATKARNPAPFIEDLNRAEKIAAQVVRSAPPHQGITAVWQTEGFAEAYEPVEEACKQ